MSATSGRLDAEHPTEANMATSKLDIKRPLCWDRDSHNHLDFKVTGIPKNEEIKVTLDGTAKISFVVDKTCPKHSPPGGVDFVLTLRLKGTGTPPPRDPNLTVTVSGGGLTTPATDVPANFISGTIF
jgi:hypothetical protein